MKRLIKDGAGTKTNKCGVCLTKVFNDGDFLIKTADTHSENLKLDEI